ncbi:hypothetical protein [Acetobacterium sp.]|uniref:hypothetical protein n=1 Tax=Acetobacterium sp. TaxID=1872094 RepID=UPI002F3F8300
MLIYLTSDKNKRVFDGQTQENGIPIRPFIGEFTLLDFVSNDLSKFVDSCRFLAVDLDCLLDVPEGLYEAIESIRMWFELRLIIFAREISPEIKQGLLDRNIYNIVTGDPNEWENLINSVFSEGGITYQDHINNTVLGEAPIEKERSIAEEVKIVTQPKIIVRQVPIKKKDRVANIMVAGSQNRTGTTTTAIQIANYLANQGKLVAYVEANEHNHLKSIIEAHRMTKEEDSMGEWWQTQGVDYLLSDGVSSNDYDYIIFDLGVLNEDVIEPFSQGNIKIICGSGNCFERDQLLFATSFCNKENIEDVNTLITFLSQEEQSKKLYTAAKYVKYAPNIMGWHENVNLYNDIFKIN